MDITGQGAMEHVRRAVRTRRPLGAARIISSRRFGMTMLETLFVMTIMGVLLAMVMPPVFAVSREYRLQNAAIQLSSDLTRARSEAIRRNQVVYLVRTSNTTYEVQHLGTRTLGDGVTLKSTLGDTTKYAPYGALTSSMRIYEVSLGDEKRQVIVSAAGLTTIK